MVKIKTLNTKKAPVGYNEIEPTIIELNQRMKDAESDPHEGKRKPEAIWPILRIHHQRSRYIYELFNIKKQISRELYDWCIRQGYGDASLIAKWKKPGYEKLCCLMCIQQKNHNYGTTCLCRVPKEKLEENKIVECVHCGCRGCASGDI